MPELFGRAYSRTELMRRVGRLEQVAGVRLVTLDDGLGRGVRVIEFRTGSGFAFDVVEVDVCRIGDARGAFSIHSGGLDLREQFPFEAIAHLSHFLIVAAFEGG